MNLLIGGSPCTHWSIAQTKDRETEPRGMGWELFLNYRIARDKYQPDYFLYENNKSMSTAIRERITYELGVEPVLINSAKVSAQNRQRIYFVGKRNPDGTYSQVPIEQPEDLGILLRDILESGICWREKAYTLDSNYYKTLGRNVGFETQSGRRKMVAEPVRIGIIESNTAHPENDSQQYRVYSPGGKSVNLCGNGGGVGARTGLYAVPCGAALRGREGGARFEIRGDQKANAVIVGHQSRLVIEAADGKTYPVYEVKDGQTLIKDKLNPIKLPDGLYIIRKLTVKECMRLQTVPEWYRFPVSPTQAYKMLGNGWTVDVIVHIMRHFPGISTEPLEVLSMYDGMSCGNIALQKIRGGGNYRYYATEIDKYAIKTTLANFPETIQLGDAFQVREDGWRPWGEIA